MNLAEQWDAIPVPSFRIPPGVQAQRDAERGVIRSREAMPNGGGAIPTSSVIGTPVKMTLADEWDSIPAARQQPVRQASTPDTAPSAPTGTTAENLAAGAGKAITDLGRGVKQLMDIPAEWLEQKFPGISSWAQSKGLPSAKASAAQTQADVDASAVRDKPLMATGAGITGNIAGTIAGTMIPLSAIAKGAGVGSALVNPTTYKAAAAAGALQGALQPTATGESRALNTGIGAGAGMLGNAVVNTVGRLAQPTASVASNAHKKAVSVLESNGIPLDAAQKSGSAVLNRIRSGFKDNPFTAGPHASLMAKQQEGFNRAVLRTMGEDAPAATSQVMGRAEQRINGVFKSVLDRNNVQINDTILNRIGQIQSAAVESEKKPVASIANRIVDAVDGEGKISGQVAYGIKKDLDRLASSADSDLAYHARQLRGTVMDAINGSLNKADKEAFAKARGQFANMKQIEATIDKAGGGDISAARLANVLGQKRNRATSVYGKGPQELVDLAQAGNFLLPDRMPNSGTTARMVGQLLPLAVAGSVGGSYYGDHAGAGLGAAAGLLAGRYAPRAAQVAMQNPAMSNYISQGMGGSMTPLRNLLLLPQTNAAVGGAARRVPLSAIQAE